MNSSEKRKQRNNKTTAIFNVIEQSISYETNSKTILKASVNQKYSEKNIRTASLVSDWQLVQKIVRLMHLTISLEKNRSYYNVKKK